MATAAEGSGEGTQWQQVGAVVEGGGALGAVVRLRNTEAADDDGGQGVVYTRVMFWASRERPQKAGGNWC